jgi:hypothetical protein
MGFRNCDYAVAYAYAIALLMLGIHLANGGGISQKVSQNLGLKDGVVELYNQNASTHQVYANVTGYWASGKRSYAVRLIAPRLMVSI